MRFRVIRVCRHGRGELFLRLREVVRVPGNDARVVERIGAAAGRPPRGRARFIASALISFASVEFLLVVVDRREAVVRVDRVRIELDRLFVGRLSPGIILLCRVGRRRSRCSTRGTSAPPSSTSLNFAIASSYLPALASAAAFGERGLDAGDFRLSPWPLSSFDISPRPAPPFVSVMSPRPCPG